jgi:hypothetical protein
MFCPSCGRENANAFGYCNSCGRALTPVPGAAPAAAPAQAPVFTQPMSRQKKRNPALIVIVIVVAGVIGGLAFLAANINREAPDQRIGRLMREAAGLQPVHKQFFSSDRRFDDTFREQYRNLIQANRDYVTAVKNADISATKKLNTPESFADPESSSEGLKQLHAVYDLDMAQEQKVREIVANIRRAIETGGWSASAQQELMKGFDKGLAEPLAKRQRAVAGEQAWIQAIDDVYGYAERNHPVFTLNNGQLVITDDQVLAEFNSRIRTMNARRTEFMQAKQEFDQWQAGLFQKMGVNGKDLGLK